MVMVSADCFSFFFFFMDTATTEIYTLSLHDALPISINRSPVAKKALQPHHIHSVCASDTYRWVGNATGAANSACLSLDMRSEEHTSELQSRLHLVCRLLLEKKKKNNDNNNTNTTQQQSAVSACDRMRSKCTGCLPPRSRGNTQAARGPRSDRG